MESEKICFSVFPNWEQLWELRGEGETISCKSTEFSLE